MCAGVMIVPEVEGELHSFSVAFTEQRPDVSCKTGCIVSSYYGRSAFLNVFKHIRCGENIRTPHGIARVWRSPRNVPGQDVQGRVVISIHDQTTFGTVIRPLPAGIAGRVPTATTLALRYCVHLRKPILSRRKAHTCTSAFG